jgi:hypothetical protein
MAEIDTKTMVKLVRKYNRFRNDYPGKGGQFYFEMDLQAMGGKFKVDGKKYLVKLNGDNLPTFEIV